MLALLILTLGAVLASCALQSSKQAEVNDATPRVPLPAADAPRPQDYPGIHNAVAFHDGFISGSVPEGDEAFDTLAAMGIRTIISVDGAMPEVDRAEARGIRYIHLPIGYDGFNEERHLQLTRATRDAILDGPVYIHCHHGKHRSAGAAAAVAASLGWTTPEEGVARMRVSGTSPNYTGLYACAAEADVISMDILDRVPSNFPSAWKPSTFVSAMVEIDRAFDHLGLIEEAGWIAPQGHPDLVPAAEAARLVQLHRDLLDGDYTARQPPDFADMMRDGLDAARTLEELLLASEPDPVAMGAQMELLNTSCMACHVTYRNKPKRTR